MSIKYIFLLFFLIPAFACAQHHTAAPDTINPLKGNHDEQLKEIKEKKQAVFSDSAANEPAEHPRLDTTIFNKYGDLLNDDTAYNKKYPLWKPAVEVVGILAATWAADRYILNADYARISLSTWKYNLKKGWEWDADKFGINFLGHPYSGALTYNAARSQGFNYLQSFSFSVLGSAAWEYFGETTRPSYNDIINTPISGSFLGEVLYRISSNILDDRTRGLHRVGREVAAGLVNPVREINRLLEGKAFHVTNKEVYQKEPLNISLYAGLQQRNNGPYEPFGKGKTNPIINIQLDYGNPFDKETRKPFDIFKLRFDLSLGYGNKIVDNITGYGLLAGKNADLGKLGVMAGIFQHYDYWDNYSYELGAIGIGPGAMTKYTFTTAGIENNLYTNIHVALVPLAGKNKETGVDSLAQVRDYYFGGGYETKLDVTLNIGKWIFLQFAGYYYYVHIYTGGNKQNTFLGILKPRLYFNVFHGINIGYEHTAHYDDSYANTINNVHIARTEEKIFLLVFLESKQRKGHYN